jgi:hypothetical protein
MLYLQLIRLFKGRGKRYEMQWITFSPVREGRPSPEILVREFDSRFRAFLWGLKCIAEFTPLDTLTLWVDGE